MTKNDGTIRMIAAGKALRRLAAKVPSKPLVVTFGDGLGPNQLGIGTKICSEATTAQAARQCQTKLRVFLIVYVSNDYSCLRRDVFLAEARTKALCSFELPWQLAPSPLIFLEIISLNTVFKQNWPHL